MHRGHRVQFYSAQCTHQRTSECHETGSEVCIDCALVLEDRLSFEGRRNDANESCTHPAKAFLLDLTFKLNLGGVYAEEAEEVATYISQYVKDRGLDSLFKNRELWCFSLFEVINRNDIGVTPQELCFYACMDLEKIWAIEKVLNIHTSRQCPSSYTSKACYTFNISHVHQENIRRICQRLYGFAHHKPTNLFCAVMKLYCIQNQLKMPFSKLCKFLNCTASSVNRIINELGPRGENINSLL